ncbi:hypothetical protein IWQ60_004526 [Tieghemiomyces parasiticus]|uniref:FAD/NAD(P)-binding domain-containing protein n=1 Tax=Tieghemiomyces parasiticus TaxID=78921 RepID=A0A9W8A828_9FUNG|nr:hypothetical protein IWQ60_004526 [Tieghemiomyces parasiticus]
MSAAGIPPSTKVYNILIVGGSKAGVTLAMELERLTAHLPVRITILEKREAYFHTVGALRAVVQKSVARKLWIPYDNLFKNNGRYGHTVIQGVLTRVFPFHVEYATIEAPVNFLPFDYLVLATGSTYPDPAKMNSFTAAQGIETSLLYYQSIREAARVLLIGGGPVGVELAGEIATEYPEKRVILVHNQSKLFLDDYKDSFRDRAREELEALGVQVILNEKVILPEEKGLEPGYGTRILRTASGRAIESDLQFCCTGISVDTHFMQSLADNLVQIVDPNTNHLRVRLTLQLRDPRFPHIFAIGDVNDHPCFKLAVHAAAQARVTARNLKHLIEHDVSHQRRDLARMAPLRLEEYRDKANLMTVSIGRHRGVTQSRFGLVFGNWYSRIFKPTKATVVDTRWKDLHAAKDAANWLSEDN